MVSLVNPPLSLRHAFFLIVKVGITWFLKSILHVALVDWRMTHMYISSQTEGHFTLLMETAAQQNSKVRVISFYKCFE